MIKSYLILQISKVSEYSSKIEKADIIQHLQRFYSTETNKTYNYKIEILLLKSNFKFLTSKERQLDSKCK